MKKIFLFSLIALLLVTGCGKKEKAKKEETTSFEPDIELCYFNKISESSINKYFDEIKKFRLDSEERYYKDITFTSSLIKTNGINANKSEEEIEKEINEYKELSDKVYQYEIDFADKIENSTNQYIEKEINLEELRINICQSCVDYGYYVSISCENEV